MTYIVGYAMMFAYSVASDWYSYIVNGKLDNKFPINHSSTYTFIMIGCFFWPVVATAVIVDFFSKDK